MNFLEFNERFPGVLKLVTAHRWSSYSLGLAIEGSDIDELTFFVEGAAEEQGEEIIGLIKQELEKIKVDIKNSTSHSQK